MSEDSYVYIVECADGTYYTGWTTDPKHREAVHNSGKGARYTRSRLPVKLRYVESCESRQEAMRREYALKQLCRAQKEALIKEHPFHGGPEQEDRNGESGTGKSKKEDRNREIESLHN